MVPFIGMAVTAAEIILALLLIVGFQTEWAARLSGFLLLVFAFSMTFSTGIKGVLDFSVYTASAAAFALSLMKEKHWELDSWLRNASHG